MIQKQLKIICLLTVSGTALAASKKPNILFTAINVRLLSTPNSSTTTRNRARLVRTTRRPTSSPARLKISVLPEMSTNKTLFLLWVTTVFIALSGRHPGRTEDTINQPGLDLFQQSVDDLLNNLPNTLLDVLQDLLDSRIQMMIDSIEDALSEMQSAAQTAADDIDSTVQTALDNAAAA